MLKRRMALVWMSVVILLGSWLTIPVAVAEDAATEDLDLSLIRGNSFRSFLLPFAEELFGPGSEEVTFGRGIVIQDPLDSVIGRGFPATISVNPDSGVSEGGAGEMEFRLTDGAQIGGRQMDANDLRFFEADNDEADIRITLVSGGAVGDTSVTFSVEARDAGSDTFDDALEAGDAFLLIIPGLRNLRADSDVRLQLSTRVTTTTTESSVDFQRLDPSTNGGFGLETRALFDVLKRFTLAADAGMAAAIDVDMRTTFETGAIDITGDGNSDDRQGVLVGVLGINLRASNILGVDGTGLVLGFSPPSPGTLVDLDLIQTVFGLFLTGRDRVRIVVGGEVAEGLQAFIDLNENGAIDAGENIPLSADGLVLGGTGTAVVPSLFGLFFGNTRNVYLVADGSTLLVPAEYTVSLTLDFDSETFLDESAMTPPTRTSFAGIAEDGFAYAIPNCSQVDRARVRITNETRDALTLFIRGVDQAGEALGDDGLVEVDASMIRASGESTLAPYETLVLFTRHIEQAFGLNDGSNGLGSLCDADDTWGGRAQLSFFSSGNITVTSLIRGSDGQLRDLTGFTGLVVEDGGSRSAVTK